MLCTLRICDQIFYEIHNSFLRVGVPPAGEKGGLFSHIHVPFPLESCVSGGWSAFEFFGWTRDLFAFVDLLIRMSTFFVSLSIWTPPSVFWSTAYVWRMLLYLQLDLHRLRPHVSQYVSLIFSHYFKLPLKPFTFFIFFLFLFPFKKKRAKVRLGNITRYCRDSGGPDSSPVERQVRGI